MHNSAKNVGFTIVELLVVIVVIGILAAITIVSYTGISQKATVASLQSDLTNAMNQLKIDQVINSAYPISLDLANNSKGIPHSPNTTYTYSYNNNSSPQTFCITATSGSTSYKVTHDGAPVSGACQAAGTISDGLIFSIDAGNTVSYSGTGTTLVDVSGNGNNCTLVNGVGYASANNGSLLFDGTNDYVDCGVNKIQPYLSNKTAVSISSWMKNSNVPAATVQGNLSIYIPIGSYTFALLDMYGSNIRAGGRSTSTDTYQSADTSYTATNTWVNLVGVFNYTAKTISIYINGVLAVQQTVTFGSNTSVFGSIAQSTQIGALTSDPTITYMNGNLSNVSVYNKQLSSAEILQNFNALKGRYGL
ncbi:MAG: LamG-like jellyroll fold domain-containing protein [Candidatus Saccharibacteria bacterium]